MIERRLYRWLLAEFFVIVFGVLAAFAVDAWWDERRDRISFERLLVAVEGELRTNAVNLRAIARAHSTHVSAGFELLHLTGPEADSVKQTHALELLPEFLGDARMEVLSSALLALLESGEAEHFEEEALRRRLANLPAEYSRLTDQDDQVARLSNQWLVPLLRQYVPQLNLRIASANAFESFEGQEFLASVPGESRFRADGEGLLADIAFENLVVERTEALQFTIALYLETAATLDWVLERLTHGGQ